MNKCILFLALYTYTIYLPLLLPPAQVMIEHKVDGHLLLFMVSSIVIIKHRHRGLFQLTRSRLVSSM